MASDGALVTGTRVVDKDNFRGVVRYIGPVVSSKSGDVVYAGVEWDDSTRGKNDGSATGADGACVRYFSTKSGAPTSASFMKCDLLSTGVPMAKALDDRYNDTTETGDNSLIGLSGKAVPVLLVGDAQIRAAQTLAKLTSASLRACGVGSVPRGSLSGLCPKIREVDLRGNLLSSWACLGELGSSLPSLRLLNLADNPGLGLLTERDVEEHGLKAALPQVRTLIVTDCGLDWPSILLLDAICPNLEELHVCKNGLARPPVGTPAVVEGGRGGSPVRIVTAPDGSSFLPPGSFAKLKRLNIGENPLPSWACAYAFALLPRLTWLLVADCGLTEVWCEHAPAVEVAAKLEAAGTDADARIAAVAGVPFAVLEQLSITGSALTSPWTLDALDAFPSLTTLRLSNTDLTADLVSAATLQAPATPSAGGGGGTPAIGPSEARQLMVARCPKLGMVNGSEVRAREREDAEKACAKKLGVTWAEKFGVTYGAAAGHTPVSTPVRTVSDVFGPNSVQDDAVFKGLNGAANAGAVAAATTLSAPASIGFSKGADSGVIRAKPGVDKANPFYTTPLPLWPVSYAPPAGEEGGAVPPPYLPALDPYALGAGNPVAAGALQALFPRYFMLAAKYDLHAPVATASGALAAMGGAAVTLTLRSMAGSSCMMDPAVRKLPVTTSVGALKQLASKLFKIDPTLARISFRDSPASFPSLLEDDLKPLSYYAVCEGGEVLIEEVDPAEAARQASTAAAAQAKKEAAQEAQGEALRRAQESSVTAQRRAATVTAKGPKEEDERI